MVRNKMYMKPIERVEVDVKVTPQNGSGGTEGGVELWRHLFLTLTTLYPRGKSPDTQCRGGWLVPKASLERY